MIRQGRVIFFLILVSAIGYAILKSKPVTRKHITAKPVSIVHTTTFIDSDERIQNQTVTTASPVQEQPALSTQDSSSLESEFLNGSAVQVLRAIDHFHGAKDLSENARQAIAAGLCRFHNEEFELIRAKLQRLESSGIDLSACSG